MSSSKNEEMTRHVAEIFNRLDDPIERSRAIAKKNREEITKEKLDDYNLS